MLLDSAAGQNSTPPASPGTGTTPTAHCDSMRIDVDGVVHIVPRCDEGLDRGNVDGRVREYALGVEGDHFDVRPRLGKRGEVPEDRETWLGKRLSQLKAIKPCMSHIARTLHQLRTTKQKKISESVIALIHSM